MPVEKVNSEWLRIKCVRLDEILKTRKNDRDFKLQIEHVRFHTCEKHFASENTEICKFTSSLAHSVLAALHLRQKDLKNIIDEVYL